MSPVPTRARPTNAAIRCVCALAVVWVLSFALYPLHLTALAAVVWIIATLALVPIGTTLTDRIVGFLLLAAAPAVLIAWFTPFVPWLVSAPVLTGLLGSLVAIAWGLRWTRSPVTRPPDAVTIGLALLTGAFYWIPFASGGLTRAVSVLSLGYDTQMHYLMWMRVWANHGYLVFNTLADPDAWIWRTYPQGAQVLLADIGSVLTGDGQPPGPAEQSVALFAILVCIQAGVLALVTAWSVDRLSRSRKNPSRRRVVIFQIFAVLLVAVGPGSAASVHSLSFTTGLIAVIPALTFAVTAKRSPRLAGLLIGASFIAAAAIYPICALLAILVWPLYLWTSRRYWLVSRRRRWNAVACAGVVALLCAPMFVFLLLRNVDHGWETPGSFVTLHVSVYTGVAILLGLLIMFARGRLPIAVQYTLWVAAVLSIALAAEGILQWKTSGNPKYYTVKTIYLGWMLAVIAVAASLAVIRRRRASTARSAHQPLARLASGLVAGVLVVGAIWVSIPLAGFDEDDPGRTWSRALSKEGWVVSNASGFDGVGLLVVQTARRAAQNEGVTVAVPCTNAGIMSLNRWVFVLNGGLNPVEWEVLGAVCSPTEKAHLGSLPEYLQMHPEETVNALATDQEIYDYAVREKEKLRLSNLNVVLFFETPSRAGQN